MTLKKRAREACVHYTRGLFCAALILALSCPLPAKPEDPAAKSLRARELMAAGKFDEAIPLCNDLVVAHPDNPSFRMNLGLALHMAGYARKAVEQFEAVLKLDSSNLPARLFLGEAYITLGEPANAISPLEYVTRTQPANPEARELLAEAFVSLKRFDRAAEQYQRLTAIAPENPRAWDGLRRSCEALAGQAAAALRDLAPDSPYWLVLVAETRITFDAAFYWYRQALAQMPGLRGVHKAIAEIYRKTGHSDWAAIEEEKERQLPPLDCGNLSAAPGSQKADDIMSRQSLECAFLASRYGEVINAAKDLKTPESYYWQARAYHARAQDAFTRLGRMKPSAQLHQVLAKIYLDRRLFSESAKEWQEALKFSPGDLRLQKGLAVALSLSGDFQAARTTLENLVKREPDSAELNYLLGDTLLNSNRADEAVPLLQKAVDLNPGLLPAHKSLGRAYLKIGKNDQAILHLKTALPADDDGSLYYQLARAYRSTGQIELADQMLKRFQDAQSTAGGDKTPPDPKIEITPP